MAVVFAAMTGTVSWSAGRTHLNDGDAWDSTADLVRERPDLFDSEPTKVLGRRPGTAPVESATRAPGEKRAVRR